MTTTQLNSATVVGGALTLFGAAAVVASFGINPDPDGGWGARIFPLVSTLALTFLGVLELASGLRGRPAAGTLDRPGTLPGILALLALSLGYVWLMSKLGYLLSTAVAAPLALWLFGVRRPLVLLLAAVLCPALYHAVFFVGLGVFPPLGEWFDLLDLLQGY